MKVTLVPGSKRDSMNIKKAPYQLAYEERLAKIEQSLKSEHRGAEPSRDPKMEIRPTGDSIQLGEGSK